MTYENHRQIIFKFKLQNKYLNRSKKQCKEGEFENYDLYLILIFLYIRFYSKIVWMKEEIKIFSLIKVAEIELCLSIVNFQATQSSGKRLFILYKIFWNKVYYQKKNKIPI